MTEQCYLAVDLGTESGRVIAGLLDGEHVWIEELHRFSNNPVNLAGTLRWNVLSLWTEIQRGLAKAAARHGDRIVSVGVDTWGVDYVLLSSSQELLGQPYCYLDGRTRGVLDHVLTRIPRKAIFTATGVQFMEINTLYQLVATQQTNRQLLELAARFLMLPDFFHWLLSGSRVTEFTNATTTQCLSPATRDWAFDLLGRLGLPTDIFPEIVEPGTKLGTLREDVTRFTGLRRIDVVTPVTHDTGSAVAAIPTQATGRADWAYIIAGTRCLMGVEVQQAVLSSRAMELSVTNEGGIDGTYRLQRNIMGLWLIQQSRQSFERKGKRIDYLQLPRLAAEAPPFRSFVDPDDPSFLNTGDLPTAIQQWCRKSDQPAPETEGQIVRCVLESLALKFRVVLGCLQELTGTRIEVLHVMGGGAQNRLLNQFTANACGRPVVSGPIEATALGNVLVQARANGEIASLAELRDLVRKSNDIEQYEPKAADMWQQAYQRFVDLLSGP